MVVDGERTTGIDVLRYDLATSEKLPVIRRLLEAGGVATPAIDIGSGTGHLTNAVLGAERPVAVDAWLPNLVGVAGQVGARVRLLNATGSVLPIRSASVGTVLCSEVLEHIEDDRAVVAEIARILRPGGVAVITVPSLYYRVDTYLRFIGVKTVHDFPGPEQHVRRGYRDDDLREMLSREGLDVDEIVYLYKPFSKLAIDAVALAHLTYERVLRGRKTWTWADAVSPEIAGSVAFRIFTWIHPMLKVFPLLDRLLRFRGGFGLALRARRRQD